MPQVGDEEKSDHQIANLSLLVDYISEDESKKFQKSVIYISAVHMKLHLQYLIHLICYISVFMPLVPYSKDLALGELCLLGQKVTTPPFGIIWPQVWPLV